VSGSGGRDGAVAAGGNLWRHTADVAVHASPLSNDVAADAIVVGGGFTGCSAALHLAEAGASVVLLEAGAIGDGGSGRNVGLVNAGLWLEPDTVERKLGTAVGARLNAILADGPDLVFALIERHGIACEATRAGTLHCAHSAGGLANLTERLRQYQARGWPVRLLSAGETRAKTGTDAYRGALLDARAGTIQPLAYARGLALAAMDAGARLHERSPVAQIARGAGRWRVATPEGSVTADALLIATNAYHAALAGAPAPRYTPVHYFQFATAPLGDSHRRTILPEGQGCWDTATVMSSFRLDAAGRLLVGGIGSLDGPGRGIHQGWARRKLAALFPQAGDTPFDYGWHGRIAMTSDHIPKIVSIGPRAIGIHGYSGRGIAPGTVFGKAAAGFLASGEENLLPLPLLDGYGESLTRLKAGWYETGASAFHLVNSR
jgi:glycine/D-amino acid oxidase-like deaminating enzyme